MKRIFAAVAAVFAAATSALIFTVAPAAAAPGDEPAPQGFALPAEVDARNLSETDVIFLEKVRQAGLWEIPAGQWAAQKGVGQRVKEVGRLIAADHVVLDDDVRRVAERFSVPLPNEVTPDQRLWLAEMEAASGKDFDIVFAQRLRYAHGAVYAAIAQVRAGSRNQLMRDFAKHCEIFVHRHMTLLESTGEVNFSELPPPVVPRGNLRANEEKPVAMLVAMFAVTGAIGIAGVARALRGAV